MRYNHGKLLYVYLIMFLAFAGFAVLAGVFSAPMYKNTYIQRHGQETMAIVTGSKYDHSSGSDGNSTHYYFYTYQFEIDGKLYSGKTTGQHTSPVATDNATLYIKIKYLPGGESCAADYAIGNELAVAIASYFMAAIAMIFLYFILANTIRISKIRKVLLDGKEGKANFIRMKSGLHVGKKTYYRIEYGFDFPARGYKKIKTPCLYSYEEVQSVLNDGFVDIKYDHEGRSAVDLDTKKFSRDEDSDIYIKQKKQIESVEMPAVFQTELGDKMLTELYSKRTKEEIKSFLEDIKNRDLPPELVIELENEAELCLATTFKSR